MSCAPSSSPPRYGRVPAARAPQSCIIYSLDRGQTWTSEDTGKSGTLGIGASASECVVTDLSDGRLMLNARNENKSGYRKVFTTDDMGKTWTAYATKLKALPEPAACQASQLAVENSGNIGRALLFSNPAKTAAPRALMTLKASFDEGATWPANHQVLYDSRPCCGYSDICEAGDGHIGVLYEGLNGDENIFFLRIPYGEFLPSLDVPAAAQTIRVEAEGVTAATFTVSSDDSWGPPPPRAGSPLPRLPAPETVQLPIVWTAGRARENALELSPSPFPASSRPWSPSSSPAGLPPWPCLPAPTFFPKTGERPFSPSPVMPRGPFPKQRKRVMEPYPLP